VEVKLFTAKSRVAPLKTKLWEGVVMWLDSEIVLYWLQTHPSKLKTFVANRFSEIQEMTSSASWRHVPTNGNPDDFHLGVEQSMN